MSNLGNLPKTTPIFLVVLGTQSYKVNYSACYASNVELHYVNEHNFELYQGYNVVAYVTIGPINSHNKREFDKLVKESEKRNG